MDTNAVFFPLGSSILSSKDILEKLISEYSYNILILKKWLELNPVL
ncbi:hypothetical protein [Sporanaerobacter sp. PP17-6a]|nr:hypothetical protein [Sporanaerobacter sp. PP17-6a]